MFRNRTDADLAAQKVSGPLDEFPFRQRDGADEIQCTVGGDGGLRRSHRSPRQIVHMERLLKIAAPADQLGLRLGLRCA